MRIVNRKEFLHLPSGTVYSRFQPMMIEGLMVKGDSLSNDWTYSNLIEDVDANSSEEFSNILLDAMDNGTSFSMDLECYGRDGSYDDSSMFAIYDRDDVERLVDRLQSILRSYQKEEQK
ncbi:hypothetical protein H7B90_23485 [Cohnella xylanilytica]|uniref:Uncharacterized protein n=1 Tax=Cohnella xylanilytica TaxID=557555 RepID=A0A841U7X5_9BACL|nr:hypothetical protein [Cohnella xylanilytica]MBB6694363.1 hypothetical protein [Cohnella xylanilytica]